LIGSVSPGQTDLHFHKVGTAKFTVDRKIEQRPVTHPAFAIQEKPN